MADTAMMHAAGRGVPALLVTDDEALALLISLEAAELALPLRVVREVLPDEIAAGQPVILDLDAPGGMHIALHGDAEIFVGICRSVAALPTVLRARMPHLLERPFSTAEMRQLLQQIRSGEQPMAIQTEAFPAREAASHAILMENETTVRVGEVSVRLTPKEAALMRCLLDKRGEAVTKQELDGCLGGDGTASNETVVYLCHLRRKLEKPTGLRLITTVRGVGYRLEGGEALQ